MTREEHLRLHDDIRFRGKKIEELTQEELIDALCQALDGLKKFIPKTYAW